jgi:lactate dehydrogenase-like 2-hydroxyacid dehydrogenase
MADRPVILTGFNFTKTMLAAIGERYEIAGHLEKPTPAHIPPGAADKVQALVSTGSVGLSEALIEALPRLSLFCCYGTGYERVNLDAARKRGIMSGGKVGILGLGAIGMEFVKRIKGFDVEIGYCNRNKRSDVDFRYFPNVMELATWCDYLIVALRSDASNRHIINKDVLQALGPRGHVLNISRGWAVNEADLAEALRNNVIEGAALDVYDEEPYEGTELLGLDNLVMTPHFGGGTEHAQRRMTQLVRQNLDNHFAGKPVVSPVPEMRELAASGAIRPR